MTFVLALVAALGLSQTPVAAPPTEQAPGDLLKKALDAYAAAKSYQATWSYTQSRGSLKQEMQIEVKAKAPSRILFRVTTARGAKPAGDRLVPEMQVVLDGATAWYENTSEKTYFKIQLPKQPLYTPLMFFPQMAASGTVRSGANVVADGQIYNVVEADRPDGGTMRIEIHSVTHRIRKIVVDNLAPFLSHSSSIVVQKEAFDAELADKAFVYKPPKGFKEIPTPPGAEAVFGP